MKKEVFLAVFIGFILGLIITFGIWTANKSLNTKPSVPSPTPNVEPTPNPAPAVSQIPLTLTSPQDESISTVKSALVSGITLPDIPVIISWENGQIIVISDSAGKFEADVVLESGYNRITVSVYDSQGNSSVKEVLVTFTTSKI